MTDQPRILKPIEESFEANTPRHHGGGLVRAALYFADRLHGVFAKAEGSDTKSARPEVNASRLPEAAPAWRGDFNRREPQPASALAGRLQAGVTLALMLVLLLLALRQAEPVVVAENVNTMPTRTAESTSGVVPVLEPDPWSEASLAP